MRDDPWFRILTILGVIALVLHLGGKLWEVASHFGDIIIIFFMAWLLAFVLSPLASILQRWVGVSRGAATGVIYACLLLSIVVGFGVVVPMALEQLVQLVNNLPAVVTLAQGWISLLQTELIRHGLDVDPPTIYRSADLASRAGDLATSIIANSISLVSGIASAIFSIVVVLIVSFYLVLDGERALRRVLDILPTDNASERYFFDSINRTFGGFLRGTLVLAVLNAVGIGLVMSATGLGYVLIGSILAFTLTLIPIFGSLLAVIMPILLAAILGDTTRVIVVTAVLLVYQVILFNVVWPKLIGDRMGLHPVLVFFALLVGAKEAGFVGAVFGGPVVAVVYAMGMYLLERRAISQRAAGAASGVEVAEAPTAAPARREFILTRVWLTRVWPRLREGLSSLARLVHIAILRVRHGPERIDAGR